MAVGVKYFGTVSSGGNQSTTSTDEIVGPSREITAINFKAIDALTVLFNQETVEHPLLAGETMVIEDMVIFEIKIKESGVTYRYDGLV